MPLTIDASTTEWISVDEVKQQANIKTGATDSEVDLIRGAAQDVVEGLIGPVLWRTVSETIYRTTATGAILSTWPVVSVTTLTDTANASADYTLTTFGGLSGLTAYGDLVVTYVAGRSAVPDAVRLAALIIADHLWQTQRGATPSPIPNDDFNSQPLGFGYAIPNRAIELLSPYLLPPTVA